MSNEKKVPLFDNLSDEQKTVSIPYYVHEGEMFRVERLNKRWFIAFMIVLFMLFGTNLGWVIYENQFETYSYEIQQDSGEGGNNTYTGNTVRMVGGNNYGEANDQNNGQEAGESDQQINGIGNENLP